MTAPTVLAADYDFEGDFSHFVTTCLTKEMIYVIDIRSILMRVRLNLFYVD